MLKLSLTTEPYEMNFGDEWIFLNFMAMIIEILFFYLKNSMMSGTYNFVIFLLDIHDYHGNIFLL